MKESNVECKSCGVIYPLGTLHVCLVNPVQEKKENTKGRVLIKKIDDCTDCPYYNYISIDTMAYASCNLSGDHFSNGEIKSYLLDSSIPDSCPLPTDSILLP